MVQTNDSLKASERRIQPRLEAILELESDIGELELSEIVDVGAIQDIMDAFFRLTGIALLDKAGQVLVKTGWQDICTKFHRIHIRSRQNCIESDTLLSLAVEPGHFKVYCCEDILARWGGDEFVIPFPQTAREEVEKLCERIRSHCSKTYYKEALSPLLWEAPRNMILIKIWKRY